jgi:transposase-like protein
MVKSSQRWGIAMNLTNPIYQDEHKAREHLEALLWPDGPFCPHCGNAAMDRITKLKGKSTRPGVYKCNECEKPFSVTVGTVYERSHVPLNKWLLATHLMTASKKGMSAHQLHRMLEVSYKTAWFMCHRIREAMKGSGIAPLGGEGRYVEADETYIGGKEKNKHVGKRNKRNIGGMGKQVVFALVDRDGHSHSFHVANVCGEMLRPLIVTYASRQSSFMTDTGGQYYHVGKEFARHETVNHSADEYVRGDAHTNTAECRFSLMKRAVYGTHHSISQAHLPRYLVEWDFKWNNRKVNDGERAAKALKGIMGKRLTYRISRATANAQI